MENNENTDKKTIMEKGVILVGKKPTIRYVSAAILLFNSENLDRIKIKSRGKFISKAVDVAEAVRNKFLKDKNLNVNVSIGTENLERKDGRKLSISTIEISLEK